MKQGLPTFNTYAFNDLLGETIPLNVTSVSGTATFHNNSSILNYDVMVTNVGPSTVFLGFGQSTVTFTATVPSTSGTIYATPVLSGAIYNFQKNTDGKFCDTVAAICSGSGTATIYVTSVQGS